MAKINMHLNVVNIGPHATTDFSDTLNQMKLGVFAMNGEGKSFISRTFALAQNNKKEFGLSNRLISLGSKSGKLTFSVTPQGEQPQPLSINLKYGTVPEVTNLSGYLFRVFNSEYVKQNLEKYEYAPSDDYEGYVIGKENIDVSKEEAVVSEFTKTGIKLKQGLDSEIQKIREELLSVGIRANTAEFVRISYDKVITKEQTSEKATYQELLKKINKLKELPEGIEDIQIHESGINFEFLSEIVDLLEEKYTKANFADSFLEKVRNERTFIEKGMKQVDLSNLTTCPFCEQPLGEKAKEVLFQYNQYLEDEESKITQRIEMFEGNCRSLIKTLTYNSHTLLEAQNKFDKLKVYFPSFCDKQLTPPPKAQEYEEIIEKLIVLLEFKKADLAEEVCGSEKIIDELSIMVGKYTTTLNTSAKEIASLNIVKNDNSQEQLQLRKRLCNAKYEEFISLHNQEIINIIDTRQKLKDAREDLKIKQGKKQTQKIDLIVATFSMLLNQFFGKKYEIQLNEKSFSLVFKKHTLINTAPDVLSDGEKSIVAFCYFLASTHAIVEKEDDYNKIFFIIDDPISSLDFNYVYAMAQILRSIKTIFPSIDHEKYLIFTHSVEFMGILCRSNILSSEYSLHNGKITRLKGELILPYEAHLRDIYEVANGKKDASHTTGNSIRHVLEALWRFERPDLLSFKDYFDTLDSINDDAFLLYSLSNDLSHGTIREEFPFDETIIRRGCASVIAFVEAGYKGQITRLTNA